MSQLDDHCADVARMLMDGRVVPLLGAGANLCGRAEEWRPGGPGLPNGTELARHLAHHFRYPKSEDARDLTRVSQYVAVRLGEAPLYAKLRELFGGQYEPTDLHRFLAELPSLIASQRNPPREVHQLIVSTNYDDALERAFLEAGREFDLVSYVAWGDDRGKFVHRPVRRREESNRLLVRKPIVIEEPNNYGEFSLEERTVILKVHGAVDREDASRDSYVITEDHYVDYLARTNLSALPVTLKAKLSESSTLFLGYNLRDWNLRAIFHRIWEERPLSSASWAIQNKTRSIERTFWKSRGVDILDVDLKRYVHALDAHTRALIEPEAA